MLLIRAMESLPIASLELSKICPDLSSVRQWNMRREQDARACPLNSIGILTFPVDCDIDIFKVYLIPPIPSVHLS